MTVDDASSDLRIADVDPLAGESLQAWIDARQDSARAEFGDRHTGWTATEVRARLREAASHRMELIAAQLGEDVVAAATVHLPVKDNLHAASAELSVRPRWRRHGFGSLLLAEVERRAVRAGRTTLVVECEAAAGSRAPADSFAPQHGYKPALKSLRSDLDLPPGSLDPMLAHLEAEAAAHAGGYDVLTWWDAIPDAWLDQRALLSARMSTDAPLGEVDLQEEVWDAERVQETFRVARAQGRRVVETVAVHRGSGQAVAFTDLSIPDHTPELAYQRDTLVLAEHRGHRLGQLVKAANLREVRERLPAVSRVVTWNAEVNAPMLRVNRAMGFRVVGVLTEWQKSLG